MQCCATDWQGMLALNVLSAANHLTKGFIQRRSGHIASLSKISDPCKEYYNLTIAHTKCNRTDMEAKIPREAFGADPLWPAIEANARKRFFGKSSSFSWRIRGKMLKS